MDLLLNLWSQSVNWAILVLRFKILTIPRAQQEIWEGMIPTGTVRQCRTFEHQLDNCTPHTLTILCNYSVYIWNTNILIQPNVSWYPVTTLSSKQDLDSLNVQLNIHQRQPPLIRPTAVCIELTDIGHSSLILQPFTRTRKKSEM